MTAEIAIMNKEAIAMAADSAVTLREEKGEKIFTSANKIFALSKYHPVGIMVYGSASFMGAPWEVLVKIYRRKLGKGTFDSARAYAQDFIHFLSRDKRLFPESEQESYFRVTLYSYFRYIRKEIKGRVEEIISQSKRITKNEIRKSTVETIRRHHELWRKADFLPSIPKRHTKELKGKYRSIIDEATKRVFEKLPITKLGSRQLAQIAVSLFAKWPKELSPPNISGVVVAGFGNRDIFPCLESFLLDGIVNGRLKYVEDRRLQVTYASTAWIVPFAQSEMVHTFMEGVDPDYQEAIEKDLSDIFTGYPEIIVDSIAQLTVDQKTDLKSRLKKMGDRMFQEYQKKLKGYRNVNFIQPVTGIAAMLPKDELAAMAESLVSLTLFKRKVSMEAETAAPPIDVAVISKGDGLIWIKRKHYFQPELNAQFFANYYREGKNAKQA